MFLGEFVLEYLAYQTINYSYIILGVFGSPEDLDVSPFVSFKSPKLRFLEEKKKEQQFKPIRILN